MNSIQKSNTLAATILWVVVLLIYGQSISFDYVWDDISLFVENTSLRSQEINWASLIRPILPDSPYLRPLVLLTWALEYQFFGLNPVFSHAINILIHGGTVFLVFLISRLVFKETKTGIQSSSFLAALLYAAHPCLVESVAWISGRFDLMATFLLMMTCWISLHIINLSSKWRYIAFPVITISALGAMASKETGVLFPILLTILLASKVADSHKFWLDLKKSIIERMDCFFAFFCAFIIYALLRQSGLGFSTYTDFSITQIINDFLNNITWLRTLSFYTFMGFFPFNSISVRHEFLNEMQSNRQNTIALFIAAFLFITTLISSARKNRFARLMLGFYVGIFPVLGIFKILNGETIGSERFMNLPLIFMSMSIAYFFNNHIIAHSKINYLKRPLILFIGGWIAISILVSHTVTSMWQNEFKLWSWQYKKGIKSQIIRTSYLYNLSLQDTDLARSEFNKEIEKIRNEYNGSLPYDVQVVYAKKLLRDDNPESLFYLEGLKSHLPSIWETHYKDGAKGSFNSTYVNVLVDYAQALMLYSGEFQLVEKQLQEVFKMGNDGVLYQAKHQMVVLKFLQGDINDARDYYIDSKNSLQSFNLERMQNSMRSLTFLSCEKNSLSENCNEYLASFEKNILESN